MRIQIFGFEDESKLLELYPMLADGASMVQLAGQISGSWTERKIEICRRLRAK